MRDPGDTPTALRLRLLAGGYHPLPCEGKAPTLKGWQGKLDSNEAEIRLWERLWPAAGNTGFLTKFTPCLDNDITDEAAAEAVEALARERFEEGGDVPVRFGKTPKRAILFRTDEPFAKLARSFTAPNGQQHKIEILGDGQQVILFGIHPETLQPYTWHGGSPAEIPRERLPYIREAEARQLVEEITELLVRNFGYTHTPERQKAQRKDNGSDTGSAGAADWQ